MLLSQAASSARNPMEHVAWIKWILNAGLDLNFAQQLYESSHVQSYGFYITLWHNCWAAAQSNQLVNALVAFVYREFCIFDHLKSQTYIKITQLVVLVFIALEIFKKAFLKETKNT